MHRRDENMLEILERLVEVSNIATNWFKVEFVENLAHLIQMIKSTLTSVWDTEGHDKMPVFALGMRTGCLFRGM